MKDAIKSWLRRSAKTFRLTFSLSGRASRADVLGWGASLILLDLILSIIARQTLSGTSLRWALLTIPAVIVIPSFALFARRMQDLNLSAWWSLPVVVLALQNLALNVITVSVGWSARASMEAVTRYMDWPLFPAFAIACIAMACLPGTRGSNRFGLDPRNLPTPA